MHKTSMLLIILGLSMTLPLLAHPQEQSLGDLARQLRAQKEKEAKKPVRVVTNDDLPARPPGGSGLSAASGMAEAPAADEKTAKPPSAAPPAKTSPEPESPDSKGKNHDYWQSKFTAARQALARAKEEQQLSEDELNLLQIQQARELDPNNKQGLDSKVQAKQSEADDDRAATEKAQKAMDDLEQEFKDSGAPEEWSKTE